MSLERQVLMTVRGCLLRVPPCFRAEAAQEFTQSAWLGAIAAVDAYDERGSLGSFASWHIRGAVLDYMRALPFYKHQKQIEAPLTETTLNYAFYVEDESARRQAQLSDTQHDLCRLLKSLTDRRDRDICEGLLEDHTLTQIGVDMGITKGRVCQLAKRATARMRAYVSVR